MRYEYTDNLFLSPDGKHEEQIAAYGPLPAAYHHIGTHDQNANELLTAAARDAAGLAAHADALVVRVTAWGRLLDMVG